jgi:hypothetical protein
VHWLVKKLKIKKKRRSNVICLTHYRTRRKDSYYPVVVATVSCATNQHGMQTSLPYILHPVLSQRRQVRTDGGERHSDLFVRTFCLTLRYYCRYHSDLEATDLHNGQNASVVT